MLDYKKSTGVTQRVHDFLLPQMLPDPQRFVPILDSKHPQFCDTQLVSTEAASLWVVNLVSKGPPVPQECTLIFNVTAATAETASPLLARDTQELSLVTPKDTS